jgi:hypothetical protein
MGTVSHQRLLPRGPRGATACERSLGCRPARDAVAKGATRTVSHVKVKQRQACVCRAMSGVKSAAASCSVRIRTPPARREEDGGETEGGSEPGAPQTRSAIGVAGLQTRPSPSLQGLAMWADMLLNPVPLQHWAAQLQPGGPAMNGFFNRRTPTTMQGAVLGITVCGKHGKARGGQDGCRKVSD